MSAAAVDVMAPVTVALLGALEVRVGGRPVEVTRPRLRALLCALALRAGQAVPMGTLAEQVWGARLPDQPHPALHSLVSQLRRLLGADVVRTAHSGYLLDLPPDAVDALRFQRLVDTARGDDPARARQLLVEALDLWRCAAVGGDLPAQVEATVAAHLVERYLSATEQRIDLDLELGRHAELVGELRELTARYELREPLWARLITALHRSGRQAEALDTYETVRALLADALGVSPSVELRGLHSRLLAADDDLPVDLPVVTGPVVPRQLPPDLTGFTGRAADLATLDRLLLAHRGSGPPLVIAVHGPGGAGKTTLALHWAHRVLDHFPDGHLYLGMRGHGPGEPVEPAAALDVVLRAVGVPAAQVPPTAEERAALWRTTVLGRRLLLLVDNVRDASQVRPLLPATATVTVLVTSRNELRGLAVRDGARRLAVGELPADEAIELVREVLGEQRCANEPAAVDELADLCGRLPLALVIAAQQAARYPDVPIAELVADLRSRTGRLDLLAEPGDPAADPRTVFSWSYHENTDAAARAFRLLSLHPTTEITVPAAAVLLGTADREARRLLDTLTSVHLLEQDQRGRYRFHDLLQAYALERALAEESAQDVAAARERILDWYLRTVAQARATAFGTLPFAVPDAADARPPQSFPDFPTALAWYNHNRFVLLAAVEYAEEHGFDRHGWQLAFALRYFHEVLRQDDDAMTAAQVAVRCADRLVDDTAILHATYTMGTAYGNGQYETARRWLRRAAELGERLGDDASTASAHVAYALTEADIGRLEPAEPWLEKAVAVATRSGATGPLAHALLNLGAIQGMLGRPEEALANLTRSYHLYRELGSDYFAAFARGNMAEAALDTDRLDDALVYAEDALALHGAVEDQRSKPGTLIVKGRILSRLGREREARETLRRALRIFASTGNPRAAEVEKLLAQPRLST
ncbi:BTAD domain-containing putative transcriptional regulator [Actinophytocola sediminis]